MRQAPAQVETGDEVDDHIAAVLKLICNELIEEIGARNPGLGALVTEFNGVGNLFAPLARQSPRKWIAKECVRQFAFTHAISCCPARRVRDISIGGSVWLMAHI
jgi:hypothetical protein